MNKVNVYSFTHVADNLNNDVLGPRKATLETIRRIQGTAIESSLQEVDESELDGNGFLAREG